MALIIGGHPRSGTTLLARLCMCHPQIGFTNELQNFSAINTSYWEHLRKIRKNWLVRGVLRRSSKHSPWSSQLRSAVFLARYTINLLPDAGRPVGVTQIEVVLRRIFPHAMLVGDKHPRYVFMLDQLAAEHGLKRVIVYRDGRDVVSSMLAKIRGDWRRLPILRELNSAEKIPRSWVLAIEAMEQHRSQCYGLRYEDLVNQPAEQLSSLASWLGVRPDGFRLRMVRGSSVGKYQTGLNAEELGQVTLIAGPALTRLNYH
jgi:hypothetical protein